LGNEVEKGTGNVRKRCCWVVKMHLLLSIPHGMHPRVLRT
jgi:hypothetical protein